MTTSLESTVDLTAEINQEPAEAASVATHIFEATVDEEGRLVLPPELRAKLGIIPGDAYAIRFILQNDGSFLIANGLQTPQVAEYFARRMQEQGITLEDVLESPDDIREKLFQERYGHLLTTH